MNIFNEGIFTSEITRPLNMQNTQINNLLSPTLNTDAATKGYVDNEVVSIVSNYLKIDGTNSMTNDLNFGNFKGINVLIPTSSNDATNKNYVDSLITSLSNQIALLVNATSSSSINFASTSSFILPTTNTILPLTLDPIITPNPSNPAVYDCLNSSLGTIPPLTVLAPKVIGSYYVGYVINLENPTNLDATVSYTITTSTGTVITTIPPVVLPARAGGVGTFSTYSYVIATNYNVTNTTTLVNLRGLSNVSGVRVVSTKGSSTLVSTQTTAVSLLISGTNSMLADLNVGNNKVINVVDPTNAQDAATKNYVDNRALLPTTAFTFPSATGNGTYSWKDFVSIPSSGFTEANFDSLPSGLYGCFTTYLPATRKGILPNNTKGYLTVYAYQNGPSPFNKRYSWLSNANNTSIVYVSTLTESTWNTWVIQNPVLTNGLNSMEADLNIGNNKVINVVDPTNAQDVATKSYVDNSTFKFISVSNPVNSGDWVRMVTMSGTEGGVLYCDITEKNSSGGGAFSAQLTLTLRYNGQYQYTLLPWSNQALNIAVNGTSIWMRRNFNSSSYLVLNIFYTPQSFVGGLTVTADGVTTQASNPSGFIDTSAGSGLYIGPNNVPIYGVSNPTLSQQVATKSYVDSIVSNPNLDPLSINYSKFNISDSALIYSCGNVSPSNTNLFVVPTSLPTNVYSYSKGSVIVDNGGTFFRITNSGVSVSCIYIFRLNSTVMNPITIYIRNLTSSSTAALANISPTISTNTLYTQKLSFVTPANNVNFQLQVSASVPGSVDFLPGSLIIFE